MSDSSKRVTGGLHNFVDSGADTPIMREKLGKKAKIGSSRIKKIKNTFEKTEENKKEKNNSPKIEN